MKGFRLLDRDELQHLTATRLCDLKETKGAHCPRPEINGLRVIEFRVIGFRV